MKAVEEKENFEKSYFCSRALFCEIFKLGKTGVIYMSIVFSSRITSHNRSKIERATPKGPKIPFLGLDTKGHKNRKIRNSHPASFCHIFQGKKELFKLDHYKYAFGRSSPASTH